MTTFVDIKYIGLLSSSLPQFKKKKEGLYNFRCPYCGDSQKSKLKARGYLIYNKTFYVYKCHNCEKTTDFPNLLRYVNKKLHDDYIFEVYENTLGGFRTQIGFHIALRPNLRFKHQVEVFYFAKDTSTCWTRI